MSQSEDRKPQAGAGTGNRRTFAGKLYIGIIILTVLLNLLSWNSTVFCDTYATYIFPIWVNTSGRVTGLFPFSVGEWMIAAGILTLILAVLCGLTTLLLRIFHKKCPRALRNYLRFFAWVLAVVCLVMTLNCFMLYHVTPFSEKYPGGGQASRTGGSVSGQSAYTIEEFLRLRNRVAERCNELSAQVERDETGYIVYSGSSSQTGGTIDMQDKAREEMRKLGETYPQLAGFYPRPKPLFYSDFMCQQNMLGWYFPFSMEANYNEVAYVMNLPATMCHELAHLKGFIYEDEANFIGYLACVQSDDIYFEYSGYLSVLGYLERDLLKAAKEEPQAFEDAVREQGLVKLLDAVYEDDIFVTDEEWERIEGKAILDTETVSKATDAFVDTTLKANGVEDGMISYSRVVELMLMYEKYEAAGGENETESQAAKKGQN